MLIGGGAIRVCVCDQAGYDPGALPPGPLRVAGPQWVCGDMSGPLSPLHQRFYGCVDTSVSVYPCWLANCHTGDALRSQSRVSLLLAVSGGCSLPGGVCQCTWSEVGATPAGCCAGGGRSACWLSFLLFPLLLISLCFTPLLFLTSFAGVHTFCPSTPLAACLPKAGAQGHI
jgi:hypothetical protein